MVQMDPIHAVGGYPSLFVNRSLPPLSPLPPNESLFPLSNSNFKNMSIDEADGYVSALSSPVENQNFSLGSDSLSPRRWHRRSNSDVPLGFSDMIQGSDKPLGSLPGSDKPIGLKRRGMDTNIQGKSCVTADGLLDSLVNLYHVDKDDTVSSGSNFESEEMSAEAIKRSATGDISPHFRHSRSLSMDSTMTKFHSSCNQLSPLILEFNEFELKKIMADEKLAEVSRSDPKLAKRILANRQSAARSKERKVRYIFDLENKVQTLKSEATTLYSQITLLRKDHMEVTNQNNELRMRIQAMERQAQLRDDLHERLMAEVQHLKLVDLGMRDREEYAAITRQQRLPTTASTSAEFGCVRS